MSSSSSSISKGQLISSISSTTDLIDAKLEQQQLCGFKQCPGCGHMLQGTQPDWVGLPAGVKFDPTDQELMEHLEAKVEGKSSESHPLIDEFIPTIEGEDGICYTHPEKLPGVTRDGLSRHFFHRPSRAYTTGTRKRRKIQMSESDDHRGGGGETRWHKTGKTRPVMGKGKQIKGCKKILVLYTNFGKNRKPEKTNWVMHQYHLGLQEEEKEGELVVSKIFYQTQPRQLCNWSSAATTTATTTRAAMEGGGEASGRSGSTSSSSKEVVITSTTSHHDQRDNNNNNIGCGPSLSSYAHALDLHHLSQGSHLSNFIPFRKSFDEATIGDVSTAMDVAAMSAQHQLHHHHHHGMGSSTHEHHHLHHAMATNAFHHINKPSESISQILCPTPLLDHQGSIILDDDSFHLSRIMLQNESFQDQQQQQQQETEHQQHDKMGGRSASGLEEIIMSCTPSSAAIKEESSITNTPEETDQWLKYSSFWHDPDNPDHHG